jgi:RNA recognition motif-containing protein
LISRTIKGFAFVEYETEEQATKAVAELNTINNPSPNPAATPGLRVVSKYPLITFLLSSLL